MLACTVRLCERIAGAVAGEALPAAAQSPVRKPANSVDAKTWLFANSWSSGVAPPAENST